MDHHIPQNDPLVVLHLELHLQDLQHHHNDQVKHLPLNKEPCLLPDLPLQAHPILHMAQQVHPALMGLQVDLPVDLPVVHTVVLLVDHREALQVDLMADLMVDLLEVHQVGHLVDIQVALHLGAHQDILDMFYTEMRRSKEYCLSVLNLRVDTELTQDKIDKFCDDIKILEGQGMHSNKTDSYKLYPDEVCGLTTMFLAIKYNPKALEEVHMDK